MTDIPKDAPSSALHAIQTVLEPDDPLKAISSHLTVSVNAPHARDGPEFDIYQGETSADKQSLVLQRDTLVLDGHHFHRSPERMDGNLPDSKDTSDTQEPNGPLEAVTGTLPLDVMERVKCTSPGHALKTMSPSHSPVKQEIDCMKLGTFSAQENEESLLKPIGSHSPQLDSKGVSNYKVKKSIHAQSSQPFQQVKEKPTGSPSLDIGNSGESGETRRNAEKAPQSQGDSDTSPLASKFLHGAVAQKVAQVSPTGTVLEKKFRDANPQARQNRVNGGMGVQIIQRRAHTTPSETTLGRPIIKSGPGLDRDKGTSAQQVVRTRGYISSEPTFSSGRDESPFSDSNNAISAYSPLLSQSSEYNDVIENVEDPFPILHNPVLPQLENSGAVANFLKSKENDKATEWSFWGQTPKPTTQPANSPHLSGAGIKSEASMSTTLGHLTKPKPIQGQEEYQDSQSKAHVTSLAPVGQQESIGLELQKPIGKDHPYQNIAIFATEDGRLTKCPPDIEGAKQWENELGNPWLKSKSKTAPDCVDLSKGNIRSDISNKERSDPRVSASFINRLGELEDLDGRSIDPQAPENGPVGGQLPIALRCPICCRFHMGNDCGEAPANCIICGGKHWVKQCDAAAKAIALTFRPGISCNRCRMMHKNMCPSHIACPICLRIHNGLCLKPSGTCRYCGAQHWENGCPRWAALDEETGFSSATSHTARSVKRMSDLVMKRFGCGGKYYESLSNHDGGLNRQFEAPMYPFNPVDICTVPDMLNYLNDQDAKRCFPPTYTNAKAIKRDVNSILRGKGNFVYDSTRLGSSPDGRYSCNERGAKVGRASRL